MCIRDSAKSMDKANRPCKALVLGNDLPTIPRKAMDYILGFLTSLTDPVSYTHLTLPTICSV
eukprot:2500950-Prorocentrum_lima.AAC.1